MVHSLVRWEQKRRTLVDAWVPLKEVLGRFRFSIFHTVCCVGEIVPKMSSTTFSWLDTLQSHLEDRSRAIYMLKHSRLRMHKMPDIHHLVELQLGVDDVLLRSGHPRNPLSLVPFLWHEDVVVHLPQVTEKTDTYR